MIKFIPLGIVFLGAAFFSDAKQDLVSYHSPYTVQETANRFEAIAKSKGITIFARIDHQKNAAGINLALRPTQLIIFGNPKIGTPLMLCAQDVAIDLPQKILIKEDESSNVWLSYNNPAYLKHRHNINGCDGVLTKVTAVLKKLASATVTK